MKPQKVRTGINFFPASAKIIYQPLGVVGIIGATQAAEALKLLAGVGRSLAGRLLMLDALSMQWREVRVLKDPACQVCGSRSR